MAKKHTKTLTGKKFTRAFQTEEEIEASKKTMATGGGQPLKKGEKLSDHPEKKRVLQPRNEDGTFDYNSSAGLRRVDPYHAERNGSHSGHGGGGKFKTLPSFLRDKSILFATPAEGGKKIGAGSVISVESKTQEPGKSGQHQYIVPKDITVEEFASIFEDYNEEAGEFKGAIAFAYKKGRKPTDFQEGVSKPVAVSESTTEEIAARREEAKRRGLDIGGFQNLMRKKQQGTLKNEYQKGLQEGYAYGRSGMGMTDSEAQSKAGSREFMNIYKPDLDEAASNYNMSVDDVVDLVKNGHIQMSELVYENAKKRGDE